MKTTETTIKFDYSNLTAEQLKAIAILQHTGDTFFVLDDKVFMGEIEAELSNYNALRELSLTIEDAADDYHFYEWCFMTASLEVEPYDENDYNMAYMCLTDSEADERAGEYIKDSLWAFNASFLAAQTGLDQEVFEAIISNGKCEDNNDTIYNLINKLGSIDGFIQDAIGADGRGHFMSSYDGEENEETVNSETYCIYRMN